MASSEAAKQPSLIKILKLAMESGPVWKILKGDKKDAFCPLLDDGLFRAHAKLPIYFYADPKRPWVRASETIRPILRPSLIA